MKLLLKQDSKYKNKKMTKIIHNLCPTCHRNIDIIEVPMAKIMVRSLLKVYKWALENKPVTALDQVYFNMNEVKSMFNHSEYARFNDMVHFSDILEKHGKAQYSINLPKAEKFLKGEISIPLVILKNPVTREVQFRNWGTINDVPSIVEFLNEEGNYVPTYHKGSI